MDWDHVWGCPFRCFDVFELHEGIDESEEETSERGNLKGCICRSCMWKCVCTFISVCSASIVRPIWWISIFFNIFQLDEQFNQQEVEQLKQREREKKERESGNWRGTERAEEGRKGGRIRAVWWGSLGILGYLMVVMGGLTTTSSLDYRFGIALVYS